MHGHSLCLVVLLQLAVVCVIVISHPLLHIWVALPEGVRGVCGQLSSFTIIHKASPAVEAHFISSKMDVVIFKHFLTDFTE